MNMAFGGGFTEKVGARLLEGNNLNDLLNKATATLVDDEGNLIARQAFNENFKKITDAEIALKVKYNTELNRTTDFLADNVTQWTEAMAREQAKDEQINRNNLGIIDNLAKGKNATANAEIAFNRGLDTIAGYTGKSVDYLSKILDKLTEDAGEDPAKTASVDKAKLVTQGLINTRPQGLD